MKEILTNVFLNAYADFSFMLLLYSLLVAVALLIVMRQTGLLRRETRWRRMFVYLYYLYIPVVFVMCGGAWSAVKSVESIVLGVIKDTKPVISEFSATYASVAWKTMTTVFKEDPSLSLKDMSRMLAENYANKLVENFIPDRVSLLAQPVVDSMKDGVARSIYQSVADMALKKVSDTAGVDHNLLRSFWTTDLAAELQGGL